NNRLFAFYGSGPIHKPGYSIGRKTIVQYSDNEGLSWSDEITVAYDVEYDLPIYSAVVSSTGAIICIIIKGKPGFQTHVVYRSTDSGLTWTEVFDFANSTDTYVKSTWSPNLMIQ